MDDTRYPCPACGAPADLSTGCTGCRRPPDPIAAEVVRLGREVAELEPAVERARRAYTELAGRLSAVSRRRAELAAVVRAGLAASAVARPVSPVGPVPSIGPGPGSRRMRGRARRRPPPGRSRVCSSSSVDCCWAPPRWCSRLSPGRRWASVGER
ncbi:hypothetical protein NKG94_42800 [Micromonospora sp. M12]